MEPKIIIFLIGIIALILYNFIEAWGHYDFEAFAYNAKIIIKRIKLKTKAKEFIELEHNFYTIDNYNFKFISKNTCFVRTGSEKIPLIMIIRPIPTFAYKITIKNDKYIVSARISFLYIILTIYFLYDLFSKIFSNQKLYFNDIFSFVLYFFIIISIIIFSIINLKKIAKSFIKILRINR
jgi:hypothetical protein